MKKKLIKFLAYLIALTIKTIDLAFYPFIVGYISWSMLGFKFFTGFGVALLVIVFIRMIKDELRNGAIKK